MFRNPIIGGPFKPKCFKYPLNIISRRAWPYPGNGGVGRGRTPSGGDAQPPLVVLRRSGPIGCVFVYWRGNTTIKWIHRITFRGERADHLRVLCPGHKGEVKGQMLACLRDWCSSRSAGLRSRAPGEAEKEQNAHLRSRPIHAFTPLPSRSGPQYCLQRLPWVLWAFGLSFLKAVLTLIKMEVTCSWMSERDSSYLCFD